MGSRSVWSGIQCNVDTRYHANRGGIPDRKLFARTLLAYRLAVASVVHGSSSREDSIGVVHGDDDRGELGVDGGRGEGGVGGIDGKGEGGGKACRRGFGWTFDRDGTGGDAGGVGVIGDAGGGAKIIGNGSQEVSTVAGSVALEPEASVATNTWQWRRRLAAGAWVFQVVFHHKFTLFFSDIILASALSKELKSKTKQVSLSLQPVCHLSVTHCHKININI